jgi:alpha-glucosidase (family GH31 glycosyl hydrolase)
MSIPQQFQLELSPNADPAAVVNAGYARFTILTGRLIRMEYSPNGQFEDHASLAFLYRRQPVPAFQTRKMGEGLEIETEYLLLSYQPRKNGFTRQSLAVTVKSTGAVWHYKDIWWSSGQLFGTARTLDGASGHTELELGLMARNGWAVIDDSKSVVFNPDSWVEPRSHSENLDLYFFGYGRDYVGCLRDFCKVSGPIPMIPRYILGSWWSRYWAFSQTELTSLMEDFARNQVPLSVCIVDMDWHLDGWTGYTWNRDLWPDPQKFIDWLHARGLRTALNLHPSDGVGPHETQYKDMAQAVGQDPALGDAVPFDIANPTFVKAYFDLLHHPYEKMGVDFWWMDWQQERVTSIPGLDPLWWLNHLHYLDLGRDGIKRSFVFSRWGGLGNHRYPIGFSGDTQITWESLAFQPYFTATAANVGYGWWSHDIGGHMSGIEDDELYTRWVQFGAFSPILRLHSTKNPYHDRRPWGRGPAAAIAAASAMRFRQRLVPYIYTMAWRTYRDSIPLVTPMYYWHPEEDAAYEARDQYWFGSQLVVAPFISPADPQVGFSRQRVWLPEGNWYHFFSGEQVEGGKWRVYYGGLEDIPVFARAGAIVPLGPNDPAAGFGNPEALTIHVFPGADGVFDLYEDDGETTAYRTEDAVFTRFTQSSDPANLRFVIEPARGNSALVPARRVYEIIVHALNQPEAVNIRLNGMTAMADTTYNLNDHTLIVRATLSTAERLELALSDPALFAQPDARPQAVRRLLRAMKLNTLVKLRLDEDLPRLLSGQTHPREYAGLSDAQVSALENVLLT